MNSSFQAICWTDSGLRLLDQRRLPQAEIYLDYVDAPAVAEAIRDMVVRGAPAIGITAAYAVVLAAQQHTTNSPGDWRTLLQRDMQQLAEARPTAVNLVWALERMRVCLTMSGEAPVAALLEEARRIHAEDIEANQRMGGYGADLINKGDSLLTHCNAGSLATGGYGTALGVVRSAWAAEKVHTMFAGETRPWLQGARLTAWECVREGIPATLITDNMAGFFMQQGKVDAIVIGADRVAANGDVANKIGSYSLAVLARYHDVPFYVAAPTSTLDLETPTGAEIVIEERSADEVTQIGSRRIAPAAIAVRHPAFDVTPAELITAIVTERGVARAPFGPALHALVHSPLGSATL